jgi:hypothetical protein
LFKFTADGKKHFPTEDQNANKQKFDKHISKNQNTNTFFQLKKFKPVWLERLNRDYYCWLEKEGIAIAPNVPAIIVLKSGIQ